MSNKIKVTFTAIAMSFAAIFMTTQSASAGGGVSLEFRFGNHHAPAIGIHRHHRPHSHVPPRTAHYCSPNRAVKKARRHFGLRHAHVVRARHGKIRVVGHHRGHRATVVFANRRGCPVIAHKVRW